MQFTHFQTRNISGGCKYSIVHCLCKKKKKKKNSELINHDLINIMSLTTVAADDQLNAGAVNKHVDWLWQDPEGKPKQAKIRDNQDGTYLVSYVPDMTGRYTILIKYGGDEIPYSPYRIRALPTGDASKCTVTGKGSHPHPPPTPSPPSPHINITNMGPLTAT